MPMSSDQSLGDFLKSRRVRLDPVALGYSAQRRRTPGLRREEVAQRANISATWYTWLEQGRGGAPSADVLNRISRALMLTEMEREHAFLLGIGRPPEPRFKEDEGVDYRLQRVLDAFEHTPALVKTAVWDIVAWNEAATIVFRDCSAQDPEQRNILRLIFTEEFQSRFIEGWEELARFVLATFRSDVLRTGASSQVRALIEELKETSPRFREFWEEKEVGSDGLVPKRVHETPVGPIELEGSMFTAFGRPDLTVIVYCPVNADGKRKVRELFAAHGA